MKTQRTVYCETCTSSMNRRKAAANNRQAQDNCQPKSYKLAIGIVTFLIAAVASMLCIYYLISHKDDGTIEQQSQPIETTAMAINELNELINDLYYQVYPETSTTTESAEQPEKLHDVIDNMERAKYYLNLIKVEIQRMLLSDGTGRADYALANAGASIISTGVTQLFWPEHGYGYVQAMLNFIGWDNRLGARNGPWNVIDASMQPGNCFAFKGTGELIIQLVRATYIDAITVEHILVEMSPDGSIRNAPKRFHVHGICDDWSSIYLGTFEYDIGQRQPIQTFAIERGAKKRFPMVRVKFVANHGHPSHTCVYRIRVHGSVNEADAVAGEK